MTRPRVTLGMATAAAFALTNTDWAYRSPPAGQMHELCRQIAEGQTEYELLPVGVFDALSWLVKDENPAGWSLAHIASTFGPPDITPEQVEALRTAEGDTDA